MSYTFTSRDYKGEAVTKTISGERVFSAGAVALVRDGRTYTVVYGLQVSSRLPYSRAATELGLCLLHQLACDGVLT